MIKFQRQRVVTGLAAFTAASSKVATAKEEFEKLQTELQSELQALDLDNEQAVAEYQRRKLSSEIFPSKIAELERRAELARAELDTTCEEETKHADADRNRRVESITTRLNGFLSPLFDGATLGAEYRIHTSLRGMPLLSSAKRPLDINQRGLKYPVSQRANHLLANIEAVDGVLDLLDKLTVALEPASN